MPENQQPAVTKFIRRQNGYLLTRERDSLSKAFLSVYRPHVTLKELCSCGNLSGNKLQNRGRYLFWRVFFHFDLKKNIGLKEKSRCNILDTSFFFFWKSRCNEPLREIRAIHGGHS